MKFISSINKSLEELLNDNKNVILYGEDILDPYGGAFKATKGLSTKFPDRVLGTPISEAALIGMAGGMSIGGLIPIVEIMFGDFIMLGADQLLNHLVKYEWMYNNKVSVSATIRATMGGRRGYGPTHSQSLEGLLSSIPGLKIISPTHYHNPGELLKYATLNDNGVKIFCEYKASYPKNLIDQKNCKDGISIEYSNEDYKTVYLSNSEFQSSEVLIISHGGNAILIEEFLIEMLIEHELSVQANFPSLISSFNPNTLFKNIDECSLVLIVEESPKNFGWGSEVAAQLVELNLCEDKKIARIGADIFPIPSSLNLENKVLPGLNDLINAIKSQGLI